MSQRKLKYISKFIFINIIFIIAMHHGYFNWTRYKVHFCMHVQYNVCGFLQGYKIKSQTEKRIDPKSYKHKRIWLCDYFFLYVRAYDVRDSNINRKL